MSDQLREALQDAQKQLVLQEEWIERVKTAALLQAVVIEVRRDYMVLASEHGPLKINRNKELPITAGQSVVIHQQTGQVIDVFDFPLTGSIVTLLRRLDNGCVEVELNGQRKSVYAGAVGDAKDGDSVMLDKTESVVVAALGKESTENIYAEPTNISFDHIAGLHDAKRELTDAILLPHKHPEIYKYYNKKPPKGILLYGPPGCGKTMLAKAAATALATLCADKNTSAGFIYIKGPEILERYVGAAEATVRRIFTQARAYAETAGHPAMIFIDEADAILGARGSGISSDMERTIVPAFLAEMDGLDPAGAIVLLATNRPDTLDPAVTRDGRIDRKIRVPRPDTVAATDIFQLNLIPIPTGADVSHAEMAIKATTALYEDTRLLYKIKTKDGALHDFPMKEIVNGGMIAGIVDQASSTALHRDLNNGTSTGLQMQDLYDAIERTQQQNIELNHDTEVEDYLRRTGVNSAIAGIVI